MAEVVGLDLGGTKLRLRQETRDGKIMATARYPTGRGIGPEALLTLIAHALEDLDTPAAAIGLGFPGLVDARAGRVRSSVILDGWAETPIVALMQDRFGLPVRIANDVKAAARAEFAARSPVDPVAVYLSLGTGIAGAIATEGVILEGAGGFAGEIGHFSLDPEGVICLCGRRGCVGAICGGEALETGLGLVSGRLACTDLEAEEITAALAGAAQKIGWMLGSVANLLNPTRIIVGGGLADLGPRLLGPIEDRMRAECFAEISAGLIFESARFGAQAGAIGAVALGRDALDAQA